MLELEIMKYSLQNLWARKSRSFLTILSIFIGIATIFIFISYGYGLYNYVGTIAAETGVDKFIVQAKGGGAPGIDSAFRLEDKDLEAIEKTRGVKEVTGFYLSVVEAKQKSDSAYVFAMAFELTSTNIQMIHSLMTVDVFKGREFKKGDRGKVMLGYNYQFENKIFETGLELSDKIIINDVKYDIIGFWEEIGNPGDDANIYFNIDDFELLYPDEDLSYGMFIASVDDYTEIDTTVERVEKNLRKVRGQEEGKEDFFVQTYAELIEQFGMVLNIVIGFIILIALISVVVSAVNTANTMVTSVLERTKEIGIMKAIGSKRSTIRNIFLFESTFLGLIAGVLGVSFGWFVSDLGGKI
ncbi:ABC transporter permease, partial [Candidatus Woesearchaeota archaeon]|nr:ABC transporter permease [Candidatus Woesearchaeota archaeon]